MFLVSMESYDKGLLGKTVKIRDSALGLSGFVSFFWWVYLRGDLSKENL